jgi:hypothetical protein
MVRAQLASKLPASARPFIIFGSALPWDDLLKSLDQVMVNENSSSILEPRGSQVKKETDLNYTSSHSRYNNDHQTRFSGRCHYCNVIGHKQSHCRKKRAEKNYNYYNKNNKQDNT